MNGPGYLAVTIQPGPTTDEAAFHDWYNTEHGPLRLRLPFILTGDRYRAADEKHPPWSAVYDVSDLACLDKRIYTRLREERSKRERQVMSTFSSLDRRIYSLLSVRSKEGYSGPAPVQLAFSLRVKESDLEELDRWFENEHVEKLTSVAGWLRTRRFRLVVGGVNGMPPAGHVEYLIVHDFSEQNGIGSTGFKATDLTEAARVILSKTVTDEERVWSHHLTFDALEEPPASIITTDGAELQFQLEGNPDDPVVVCVNSILTNFHIWTDVTSALLSGVNGKTYRVLRYNSRGYLQQSQNSNDTSFDLLADDLEYLLSRLRIDKAHVVLGVSMGGVTSINFAIRHPNKLEKFIACDCNVASSPANNQAWAERIELAKTAGMADLAKVTAERWFTAPNHGSSNYNKVINMIRPASIPGFEQNARALCNYDLKPRLADITAPGLLIVGEGDGKLPDAMQKFGIPNTTLKRIPGAGHLPMLENHDAFMEALAGFL